MGLIDKIGKDFRTTLATAMLVGLPIACGISYMVKSINEDIRNEINAQRPAYYMDQRDLNGNGIPEIFYEIDGEKYFLSIDGKILERDLEK